MKSPLPNSQMSALAYLYDHARDLPRWFGQLTARQLKDVAELMIHWSAATENRGILPMEEIERREVLRAVVMCEGNISKAAKLLNIGKTTAYRKLMQWGLLCSKSNANRTDLGAVPNQRSTTRRFP